MTPPPGVDQVQPLHRLATFLHSETASLKRFDPVDFPTGNQVKSQALLELTRLARSSKETPSSPALREALELLRTRLRENQAALALHLDAARTITTIMVEAIERDESDRTYDRAGSRALKQ